MGGEREEGVAGGEQAGEEEEGERVQGEGAANGHKRKGVKHLNILKRSLKQFCSKSVRWET